MTFNKDETDSIQIDLENELFKADTSEISLKNFEKVLDNIEDDMNGWLKKFDWDKETLISKHESNTKADNDLLKCPYNVGHTGISKKNYEKHVLKCGLKSQNHQKEDIVSEKIVFKFYLLKLSLNNSECELIYLFN